MGGAQSPWCWFPPMAATGQCNIIWACCAISRYQDTKILSILPRGWARTAVAGHCCWAAGLHHWQLQLCCQRPPWSSRAQEPPGCFSIQAIAGTADPPIFFSKNAKEPPFCDSPVLHTKHHACCQPTGTHRPWRERNLGRRKTCLIPVELLTCFVLAAPRSLLTRQVLVLLYHYRILHSLHMWDTSMSANSYNRLCPYQLAWVATSSRRLIVASQCDYL